MPGKNPRIVVCLAGLLAGCTVGPNFHPPSVPAVSGLTEGKLPARTASSPTLGGKAQMFRVGRDIPGDWWTLFHSPELNALVAQALHANPDLAAAQAALREARENRRAEQGSLFPQVSANASATRERTSLSAVGQGNGNITYTSLTSGLDFSYGLDVFGGLRRQIEQLGAQVDYERFEAEAAYLNLTANVVLTALTASSLQAQIDTTQSIVHAYQAALDVTRSRFALGGVSQVDVLQQQSLLDAQIAILPALHKQLEQSRNQLAVYLGTQPGNNAAPIPDLSRLTLPEDIPVSLPSRFVEQRPDIQASGALLHAATANVGVATSNTLPQISLSASLGRDGSNFSNLFTPAGIVASLAGSIAQPLFDGGTLSARKRAAVAAMDEAAARYSSTVNTAFQSVANALVAIQRDAETLKAVLAAQKTAASGLAVAQAQYSAGGGTYLNVLTAEQSDGSARLNLIAAQAARYTDTVSLFQALGGGWWTRADVPTVSNECCGGF